MAAEASCDMVNDNDSLLELEVKSDCVMPPFMFEPEHGISSEDESDSNTAQDPLEAVEANADKTTLSRLGNCDCCTCINCLTYFLFWDITKDAGDSIFLEWGSLLLDIFSF